MSKKRVFLISFRIAAQIFFLDGFALVEFTLAAGQGDVEFGVAVFGDEEARGDDREAFFLDGAGQFAELLFGEEEFAVALRVLAAEGGAPPVFGHVHVLDIELAIHEIAPAVDQRGLPRPDRLDLRPVQHNTRRKGFEKLKLEPRLLIPDLNRAFLVFLCHKIAKVNKKPLIFFCVSFKTVCAHAAVSGRGPKLAFGGIGSGGAVVLKETQKKIEKDLELKYYYISL